MELVAIIVFFVFLGVIIAQIERERDRLAAENAGLRAAGREAADALSALANLDHVGDVNEMIRYGLTGAPASPSAPVSPRRPETRHDA